MDVKTSLVATLVELKLEDTFSPTEWQLIEMYVLVFKPFKDATVIMSGDTYPTASSYVPMILGLLRNVELQLSNVNLSKNSKQLFGILFHSLKVNIEFLNVHNSKE